MLLSLFTFKSNLNFQSRERDKIFHTFSWRKYRCGVAIKSTSISIQMSPIHYFYQFKPLKKIYMRNRNTLISPVFQRFQENTHRDRLFPCTANLCNRFLRVCVSDHYNLYPFKSNFKSYLSSYILKIVTIFHS